MEVKNYKCEEIKDYKYKEMNKQKSISEMNHFYSETTLQRIVKLRKSISIAIPAHTSIDVLAHTSIDVLAYTSIDVLAYTSIDLLMYRDTETGK